MNVDALIAAARPAASDVHLIESGIGRHAFVVDGSRFYDLDDTVFQTLKAAVDQQSVPAALASLQLKRARPAIGHDPVVPAPVHALSLAIAQKCNLGCAYCYAEEGSFGGPAKNMPLETATASVEMLLRGKHAGDRVNLAFMGGEPLVNRAVLREAAKYARNRAEHLGVVLTFSLTTNGTLLTPADADFLEDYGFAVTISLDGPAHLHNMLRPFKSGRGSFETIRKAILPLLERQRQMQVSARVTVTPEHKNLPQILDDFIRMGFHSVGFSPMLNSPNGRGEMEVGDLKRMLAEMVSCGYAFEKKTVAGERYPFTNMLQALKEIHRGTHRPYPCGAGAGYFGVSADGDLAACHRFVGNEVGALGTVSGGVDRERQATWMADRHVHRQEPCNTCWARYQCGGGCHHETIGRERRSCDYIRGWLYYCLGAYARLAATAPGLFHGHA
ncbi:radical SAM protein [Rhizobium sp. ICMP 5592]|uniref:radical SAM/SPASM domain-containing protein n=1 Tax=Rhizobium sp. ICMP 5592 TaxID=2292445 RepID=UPI0012951805|nr:radical SAM protein [Rhizobium sp. ICMP 5592]MQB46510.1 radical SAM protein [Rhizobium sp. ICMP 5592]